MGRLVGLELHNFKSYRGTATIGFGSSYFTSIIGPNGAGKSNMMDAISFVLGVKSSHLRSQNLRDLIYRGRRTGGENTTLDEIDVDPTTAHVMAVYEKENGAVLKLKRTITSTGNSDYKINDKSVTALNYSLVLKAENILIKARNFLVFQGDVEQIAAQSAKDLTKLIETISGSYEFEPEYDQLKEEHEKALEYSNSVFSRKRTLNSESKQYKEQLAEQRMFEDQLLLKSETIKKINLYKLYHNEKSHQKLLVGLNESNNKLTAMKKSLSSHEKSYKNTMAEYTKLKLEVSRHSLKVESTATDIEVAKRELFPIEASKRALTSKINSIKSKIQDLKNDYKRQKQQVASFEKQLRDAQRLFNNFQDKIAASVSTSVSAEGQREYEALRAKFLANDGAQLEEELTLILNDRDSINDNVLNLNNQKSNTLSRISDLERSINIEINSRLADISTEINDVLTLKQEKNEARASLIKAKDEFNHQELSFNSQLRDVLLKLDELSSQQRESNKQKKLRENVSMLKKNFPKGVIKGLVCELVRPSKAKYETALLTILGRNADSIVVETTTAAHKCIELLKERRSGVATFIPLDSVLSDSINFNYLRSIQENVQPGIDILEYDDKSLEQAIQYVVGSTLVVNDVETARKLKWDRNLKLENKLVTLEGSVIHKSGLMTGGQQILKLTSSLTWDKSEWNRLHQLKDELSTRLADLQDKRPKELEINVYSDEISELDDKLPVLRNQKLSVERSLEDRKTEILYQNELAKNFDQSVIEKKNQLKSLEKSISEVQGKIAVLQDEIYREFCSKYEFKNGIQDYEDLHGATLRVRAKERAQYSKAIATLTNKLSFETERLFDIENRQKTLEQDLNKFEDESQEILASKQLKEEHLDQLEAEYEVLQQESSDAKQEVQKKLKYTKSIETSVSEVENEIKSFEKGIARKEEDLFKIDSERVNILKSCKIQNVNIPLRDGLLESVLIGENSENSVKTIYDIELDYSLLEENLRISYTTTLEAELEANLQKTIDRLEKLAPNIKAVERLKQVDSKLKEFDRDYTIARQKERKLADKFQDIRAKRHELFMEAFEHISGKIDFIYKELTKSDTSPLGGSAYLTLEDEDLPFASGIKYHAMPPMKRFRDMDLLSGGEKTMAALALLFAIHSFQPSPFFVLDEIDAALDNSNVGKIGNYIKKHAGPNFQFIVISLKSSLFEKSDALVGIYREQKENSSKTLTLDLREYPEEDLSLVAA